MAAQNARKAKSVQVPAGSPLKSVQWELHRIQAAMWLLDQIETGELHELGATGSFHCWGSYVSMSGQDLADWLRHLVAHSVADALKDADAALLKAVETATPEAKRPGPGS